MLCLGIESSCDETALALVDDGRLVDSVLASQAPLHSLFGGVVPELASREHYHYIGALFDELLERVGIKAADIDVIAVARGPGLLGSLLVGMAFAKGLALSLGARLIGVNHLHAHLLANGLEHALEFPALGLLASGGHTQLYRIESSSRFICLGRTIDDAAGEAFDKVAKALGLPYPGGKFIDSLARKGNGDHALLPRPYLRRDNLNFSFSGLKTAACQRMRELGLEGGAAQGAGLENFCASFNEAVADTLRERVRQAWSLSQDIRHLWLAGGVAANRLLREKLEKLAQKRDARFLAPSPQLCQDNGAMIAYAGWLLARDGYFHTLDVETIPRGKKIPDDMLKS